MRALDQRTPALDDYQAGVPTAEIAQRHGISRSKLQSWARAAGLPTRGRRPKDATARPLGLTALQVTVGRYDDGSRSAAEVAELARCSTEYVAKLRRQRQAREGK